VVTVVVTVVLTVALTTALTTMPATVLTSVARGRDRVHPLRHPGLGLGQAGVGLLPGEPPVGDPFVEVGGEVVDESLDDGLGRDSLPGRDIGHRLAGGELLAERLGVESEHIGQHLHAPATAWATVTAAGLTAAGLAAAGLATVRRRDGRVGRVGVGRVVDLLGRRRRRIDERRHTDGEADRTTGGEPGDQCGDGAGGCSLDHVFVSCPSRRRGADLDDLMVTEPIEERTRGR
jgi:hypothetical protein